MDNKELEQKIKEIVANENMFDMIIAAKEFEKEYKTSDFYKATKMPMNEVLKSAKAFYTINWHTIKEKIQYIIDNIDLNSMNQLFDQVADIYSKENSETASMIKELQDFKNIMKKD